MRRCYYPDRGEWVEGKDVSGRELGVGRKIEGKEGPAFDKANFGAKPGAGSGTWNWGRRGKGGKPLGLTRRSRRQRKSSFLSMRRRPPFRRKTVARDQKRESVWGSGA